MWNFFKSISIVAREKGKLIRSLPEDGLGVLNADDPRVIAFSEKHEHRFSRTASKKKRTFEEHTRLFSDGDTVPLGLTFKLEYAGKSIPVRLPGVLAEHHILAALAAGAVGIFLKMSLLDVRAALQSSNRFPVDSAF
ncbi:MAG: hypothetical protein IPL87_03975 [Candidatus Moraniibacteriota bacterium]|nr:MAG: hypothetical protein IPL87_03975 [Candidatus Moranbacteria bacterium]